MQDTNCSVCIRCGGVIDPPKYNFPLCNNCEYDDLSEEDKKAVVLKSWSEPRCPHWVPNDYGHDSETAWRCDWLDKTHRTDLHAEIEPLRARLSLISDEVKDERARHDAVGQGGQKAGDRSPRMNRSMLVELERLIGEEQGKYTYEYFLKMQDEINELKKQTRDLNAGLDVQDKVLTDKYNAVVKENAELRASIEKLWKETE